MLQLLNIPCACEFLHAIIYDGKYICNVLAKYTSFYLFEYHFFLLKLSVVKRLTVLIDTRTI
jgi:hypothetical protein